MTVQPVQLPATQRGIRIDHLLLAAMLLGVFVITCVLPVQPYDFWWHLKAGEVIAQTHQIPTVDQFSFTMAGKPYDNYAQFWLLELLFFGLYQLGSLPLVIFVHALAVTLAYGILFLVCRAVSSWRAAIAGVLFAVGLSFPNWNLRPQGFVLVLAATLLWCIYQELRLGNSKPLLFVPPIMLVWANSHGSWTMGLVLLGIYFLARVARALGRHLGAQRLWRELRAPFLAVSFGSLAVLVNPRGLGILRYVLSMAGDPVSQTLGTEWVPATLQHPAGALFIAGFLLSSVVLMLSPRRPDLFEVLLYLVFGVLGLRMIRADIWYGLVMAPVMAAHFGLLFRAKRSSAPRAPARQHSVLNFAFLLIFVSIALLASPWLKPRLPLQPKYQSLVADTTPVAAVDFLNASQLPGEIFNEQGFGSYLIWASYPNYRVFVDSRLELYSLPLFEEYLKVSEGTVGWEQKLESHGVRTLLLSPKFQKGLVRAASESPSWRRLYSDESAVLFVKVN